MRIRDGREEEQGALEALQRRASLVWEDTRAALEAHPEAIAVDPAWLAAGVVRVAELHGRVAGFSVVLDAELDGLFVEPELSGRGVGRALVEDAAVRAASALTVVAHRDAAGFYARVGFVEVGEVQTQFAPATLMRRPPPRG